MQRFVSLQEVDAQKVERNHGGTGPIEFRRLLTRSDFAAPIDFVDFTVIPPGSTIGIHQHNGNEEIYFIAAGNPLVGVDDQETRLTRGSIAVVRSGQTHHLLNDTGENVEIFVIQVRHTQADMPAPRGV